MGCDDGMGYVMAGGMGWDEMGCDGWWDGISMGRSGMKRSRRRGRA